MCRRTWCIAFPGVAILACGPAALPQTEPCSDRLAVGFSAAWIDSDVPFEGILGGETAAGELRVLVPESARGRVEVFAGVVTQLEPTTSAGSWSLGITLEGAAGILSATQEGCFPAPEGEGGLVCTRGLYLEILPEAGGQEAVVSLWRLTKDSRGRDLRGISTRSIMTLLLEADEPQGDEEIRATLRFQDLFTDSVGPVTNMFGLLEGNVQPCNLPSASLQVTFEKAPPARFVRGNANADLKIDIADPIWLLNGLFGDGPEPSCRDAADTNDDGRLDITDAVQLLNRQFLGTEPPRPPFPGCGTDPQAGDGLTCLETQPSCA